MNPYEPPKDALEEKEPDPSAAAPPEGILMELPALIAVGVVAIVVLVLFLTGASIALEWHGCWKD